MLALAGDSTITRLFFFRVATRGSRVAVVKSQGLATIAGLWKRIPRMGSRKGMARILRSEALEAPNQEDWDAVAIVTHSLETVGMVAMVEADQALALSAASPCSHSSDFGSLPLERSC